MSVLTATRVIVTLYSALVLGSPLVGLPGSCMEDLDKTTQALSILSKYEELFGEIDFNPIKLTVCVSSEAFNEIKDGHAFRGAYKRAGQTIILRADDAHDVLAHEVAHLYVDLKYGIVPYSISEALAIGINLNKGLQSICTVGLVRSSCQIIIDHNGALALKGLAPDGQTKLGEIATKSTRREEINISQTEAAAILLIGKSEFWEALR